MNTRHAKIYPLLPLLLLALLATRTLSAQRTPLTQAPDLRGTSWQLVEFEGGDGTRLIPDERAKYTIAFGTDGRVSVRIDCNRGSGSWRSAGPNHLEFGPLALTRAMCPPGSLHDRIVRHWPFIRSYVTRDGHLFLSLMADGGIYEFEPMGRAGTAPRAVQGTAAYRERIAMPPNAAFEAILEHVSRGGARAEVIAQVRNEHPGNPPIPFTIAYDQARIDPRRSYSVRGRILVDGRLWFTTEQQYPVLTRGHGSVASLQLRRVSGSSPAVPLPRMPSVAPLENTYWKLTQLGGSGGSLIMPVAQQREAHFILHPANRSVTGSGGCNRLSGSYELKGDRISFRKVASTMMACVDGMDMEPRFLRALGRVNQWKIAGPQLELSDAGGTMLARFEAVYLR
jgi:putative lipoprotein